MRRKKSIQGKLFKNYFVLILVVVLLFLLASLVNFLNIISDNASQALLQTVSAISSEIEMELDKANSLQKRILFSEQFGEVLFSDAAKYEDTVESLKMHRELNRLSDTVCGPDEYRNFQMYYWNSNGGYAGVGYNAVVGYKPGEINKIEDLKRVIEGHGKKVISAPYQTAWAKNTVEVLSLYRVLNQVGTEDYVVIETQIDYQNIRDIISRNIKLADADQGTYSVLIFNEKGENIYISKELEKYTSDYTELLSGYETRSEVSYGRINNEAKLQMFTGVHSQFLDWNIWIIEDQKTYAYSFGKMALLLLTAAAIVIVILWLVTYTLTGQLVKPLLMIHQKMKSLDLNELDKQEPQEIGGDIEELTELDDTFNQMCVQLRDSREKLKISHENEMDARFLAMQAQMNPHFLYNILSILKIMGKEAKSESIVEICTELSLMLRYISTSERGEVTIGQEQEHCLNYLKLMKVRFQEQVEFVVEIPDSMENIRVPRLILQPLVENSIKYAAVGRPPWEIKIKGWCEKRNWYLAVKDNGPGFREDVKSELEEHMRKDLSEQQASASIGGMGILNIYSRLYLLYGRKAYLKIRNHQEGGAEIIIGGDADE